MTSEYFNNYKRKNERIFDEYRLKKDLEKAGQIKEFPRPIPKRAIPIKEPIQSKYLSFREKEKIVNLPKEFNPPKINEESAESLINSSIDYENFERKNIILPEKTRFKEQSVRNFKIPNSIKILIIIIPFILILYLVYTNFLISHDFEYYYDIGSELDLKKPYLTPIDRVSNITTDEDINYRSLLKNLVYFNVPVPRGSKTIKVEFLFKDNFPSYPQISIGAKDDEVWHYLYKEISIPYYNDFSIFESIENKPWLIGTVTFNIKEDNLYVKNNQESFLFNVPHLASIDFSNNTIPIDWVKITVHKQGLFEKWSNDEE